MIAPTIPPLLIVSLDTEEDNWNRSRTNVTVENIRELPRQAKFFERHGVRPTYFTSYQVAIDPCAAAVLCEVAGSSSAEIGAHLHPWNTPPLTESFVPRNSMTKNLPAGLQLLKIRTLTAAIEAAFGRRPTAFRAGRYGIGPETVSALVSCGYRVDSSVSPFVSLEAVDDGPSFVGAPAVPYRLAPGADVRQHNPNGAIAEIPLSYGFSRGPFSLFEPVQRLLEAAPLRWLRMPGIAARTGVIRRLSLCPEWQSVPDMLTLSARLLEHGAPHLHVTWHTPSLMPGLSPFTGTAAAVERLYATIERYFDGLVRLTPFQFVTVSEAAVALLQRSTPPEANLPHYSVAHHVLPSRSSQPPAPGPQPSAFRGDACSKASAATGSLRWSPSSRCTSSRRSRFISSATTGTGRGTSSMPSRAISGS